MTQIHCAVHSLGSTRFSSTYLSVEWWWETAGKKGETSIPSVRVSRGVRICKWALASTCYPGWQLPPKSISGSTTTTTTKSQIEQSGQPASSAQNTESPFSLDPNSSIFSLTVNLVNIKFCGNMSTEKQENIRNQSTFLLKQEVNFSWSEWSVVKYAR